MWEKRNERMIAVDRETQRAMAQARGEPEIRRGYQVPGSAKRVSDTEMFQKLGIGSA